MKKIRKNDISIAGCVLSGEGKRKSERVEWNAMAFTPSVGI